MNDSSTSDDLGASDEPGLTLRNSQTIKGEETLAGDETGGDVLSGPRAADVLIPTSYGAGGGISPDTDEN